MVRKMRDKITASYNLAPIRVAAMQGTQKIINVDEAGGKLELSRGAGMSHGVSARDTACCSPKSSRTITP
jgi:Zn-dependent alcohol dehydrogenase